MLERLASSLGGRTIAKSFADPDAALGFCSKNFPDLVLLAAASAQGEAAEFISRWRDQPGCADVAVIVIGSEEDFDCIERAREAGSGANLLSPADERDFR